MTNVQAELRTGKLADYALIQFYFKALRDLYKHDEAVFRDICAYAFDEDHALSPKSKEALYNLDMRLQEDIVDAVKLCIEEIQIPQSHVQVQFNGFMSKQAPRKFVFVPPFKHSLGQSKPHIVAEENLIYPASGIITSAKSDFQVTQVNAYKNNDSLLWRGDDIASAPAFCH